MEYTDNSYSAGGVFVSRESVWYVEFYIDQFLLEHFLTGCLLLTAAAALEKTRVPWKRIAAGSLVNTVLTMCFLRMNLPGWNLLGIIPAGGITFFRKKRHNLWKSIFLLLLVTVCFGGVLEALLAVWGLPLMAGTPAAALLLRWAGKRTVRMVKTEGTVMVRLQWEGRSEEVSALIDSGNHLREPLTGSPVSIIDAECARRLLGREWEKQRGFFLIPYHSIGTEKGWLQGVTIDRMHIVAAEDEAVIFNPVLAIYKGHVSAGKQYQMILHPLHAALKEKK